MSVGFQLPYAIPFTPLEVYPSAVVPISDLFNNQAASKGGYVADFDGWKSSYDAEYLPTGPWVYDGITVILKVLYIKYSVLNISQVRFTPFLGTTGRQFGRTEPSGAITCSSAGPRTAYLVCR